jgi:hypothetical protein
MRRIQWLRTHGLEWNPMSENPDPSTGSGQATGTRFDVRGASERPMRGSVRFAQDDNEKQATTTKGRCSDLAAAPSSLLGHGGKDVVEAGGRAFDAL